MPLLPVSAVTGVRTADLGLQTTAQNLASSVTEEGRRRRVVRSEQPGGGVTATTAPAPPSPGTPAIEDVVALSQEERALELSVATLRAADRMLGALIDIKA